MVWSAIGATAPPGIENSGHNNNLSFIIEAEGEASLERMRLRNRDIAGDIAFHQRLLPVFGPT